MTQFASVDDDKTDFFSTSYKVVIVVAVYVFYISHRLDGDDRVKFAKKKVSCMRRDSHLDGYHYYTRDMFYLMVYFSNFFSIHPSHNQARGKSGFTISQIG